MTADESLLEQHWREAAGVIARHLSKGRDGAFVTLGDPTLYSTFTYILKQLRDLNLDIPVEIVPGISAVNAISSTLQQALAEGKEDLVISPALQDQAALNNLIGQFDNIVLMAGRQIDKICRALEEKGQDKQAFVVSRCGFADAAIHSDIFALRGKEMDYLSTVIIKKKEVPVSDMVCGSRTGRPGAAHDKGYKLLKQADVVVYAGSLVNEALLQNARPGLV